MTSIDAQAQSAKQQQPQSALPYHIPILSKPDLGFLRAPGPGLGNLLFPIARAFEGQRQIGGTFVMPTMRQIKIGPVLRFERDKRTYGEIFRPRSSREMAIWARAITAAKVSEVHAAQSAKVIAYSGMADQFRALPDDSSSFRAFLHQTSRYPVLEARYDIAIHFRKGDFVAPAESHARQSVQLPVGWYRKAYDQARDWLGKDQPNAILFTDGNPVATADELGIDTLAFEPPGNALTSLLAMSQAKVLIPSRSTFSLWAQYLGKSTAFWPKGFDLGQYKHLSASHDRWV